ncbi:alcohol dehydrogenase catalytic domain-containing protein [Myxococcota bacterium]|nr:alcohol dehydrogenase catalytic domain-containing protein [Myxococcota bacterium]
MKAVRNTDDGIQVMEIPEPEGREPVVRIRSASICGSDFDYLAAGTRFVLGHELAGIAPDGRAVGVESMFGCGTCELCEAGRHNLCTWALTHALGLSADGGMCEHFEVPERHMVPLPSAVPVEDACLIEPLAVALHGLRIAQLTSDQGVGIIGAGAIGLLTAAGVVDAGAEAGIAARHPHQIEAAERLGAQQASGTYPVVVEASGTVGGLEAAVEMAEPGGTLVVLGVYENGIPLPMGTFLKELVVLPSIAYCRHNQGRDVDDAAALLARRPEVAETVITHRFPIDDAPEAFRVAADRAAGALRVVIHPS